MLLMTEIKKISNLIKLNNKLSVVTGGTGHLGLAISETLAELGSDIILVGQDEVKGNDVVKRLSKEFESIGFFGISLEVSSSNVIFSHFFHVLPFTFPSTICLVDSNNTLL